MEKENTYTPEEIDEKISELSKRMDNLIKSRKSINQTVRELRKQVEYWVEIDPRQTKMF